MASHSPLAIPDLVHSANQSFIDARQGWAAPILARQSGLKTAQALSDLTDHWLRTLWTQALPPALRDDLSLFAIGSYGRQELAFFSDIDLLIALHDPHLASQPELALAIERFITWARQPRLRLSHAVRTAQQTRELLATDDLHSAIALIDLRPLTAPAPVEEFTPDFVINHLRKDDEGRSFVHALFQGHRLRVERQGQTVYLLEPDLKSGEGGLRDLNYMAWAARIRWQFDPKTTAHPQSGWTQEKSRQYLDDLDQLLAIRNQLHLLRKRDHNRLAFQEQEGLAAITLAEPQNLSAPQLLELARSAPHDNELRKNLDPLIEELMSAYYRRARQIATACERTLRRWAASPKTPTINRGPFEQQNELLLIARGAELTDDDIFLAIRTAGQEDLLLDPRLETAIENRVNTWPAGDHIPAPLAHQLRDLLVDPQAPWRTSRRLLELGILPRIIPEFEPLICHVQHDLYHVYTTDLHSLKCLEAARDLLHPDRIIDAPRWSFFAKIAAEIDDISTFLLASLLHDIGKNRGGQHSEKGAQIMKTLGPRLGLSQAQTETLRFLVLHHLDLSTTARRRDIADPSILSELASRIGSLERLRQLTALTFCDISTVGPQVMNDWTASLLIELYQNLHQTILNLTTTDPVTADQKLSARQQKFLLAIAEQPHLSPEFTAEFLDHLPPGHLRESTPDALLRQYDAFCQAQSSPDLMAVTATPLPVRGVTELIVCAPDQVGILAQITGAITSCGVNIMAAQIVTTTKNHTLDIFHIAHFTPRTIPPSSPRQVDDPRRLDQLKSTILDTLQGRLDADTLIKQRQQEQRLPPRHTPHVDTEVLLASQDSDHFTIIEVRAPDRLGLLYTIAQTLLLAGVNTRIARIDSLGNQAIDTFYIEERDGSPLSPEKIQNILTTLRIELLPDDA